MGQWLCLVLSIIHLLESSVYSDDVGERCDWLNAALSNVQAQVLEYPQTQELNAAIELVLEQYTPT